MKSIYDFTYEKLVEELLLCGEKKYRAQQVFSWLYQKRVSSFDMMSDVSKASIEKFKGLYNTLDIEIVDKQVSKDLTTKYLFKLADGSLIESVLMHFDYGKSLCVTSQVGCNMGCAFCASGLLKKTRSLTAGEMVAQVLRVQMDLDESEDRLTHVVVMGIGEPFDNYDNVMDFCRIINDNRGLAIGARHITISTCGIVPKILEFSKEHTQFNLAISLHAPNDELRSKLMPINKRYSIKELMDAIDVYLTENNRRITFEYIMLEDINDTVECALELARLIKGKNAYVNLIPFNTVDEHGFKPSSVKASMKFYDTLMKNGVKCTLRTKHGDDIDAACGQLRAKHERSA